MDIITLVVGPLETNCYVLVADRECLVVDPDSATDQVVRSVSDRGSATAAVILTHGHVDHALGSREVAERLAAPLLAHSLDAGLLRHVGRDAWLVGAASGAPVVADGELAHNGTLAVGSERLTVLHTPGHSPGSVCLLGDGFLLSGDLVFRYGVGRTDLPGGSWRDLRSSVLNVVFSLPPETVVYPGHGPSTTVGDEMEFWRQEGWLR
jgi:hydroxyacylglutathione hydrolase